MHLGPNMQQPQSFSRRPTAAHAHRWVLIRAEQAALARLARPIPALCRLRLCAFVRLGMQQFRRANMPIAQVFVGNSKQHGRAPALKRLEFCFCRQNVSRHLNHHNIARSRAHVMIWRGRRHCVGI